MAQTFKPKSDKSFNLFLNELSSFTPLWSSIDEGLTVPTDSDFIQIDPVVANFGSNVVIGGFLNCTTSQPNFNKFRIRSVQAKIRIDTNGVDVSVSMRLFDKDFVHILATVTQTINTSGFTDFILDMTMNLTDIDDWVLDEVMLHLSAGNVTTSTTPAQLVDTQISVFEIEVITFTDCIVERLPEADGEFFIPTTWENELNVNHLLWESVATSGDAEFVKALNSAASGDTLFEFQGVGRIPESGIFRFRAKNNGVDDSALDDISLYDNLTHSIVGSGHLAHFELSGDYHTYEAPITFLQTGFNPSSLYTVGTEISATGVLGIADTEISTQQLTLFMPNSYCCLSQGSQNISRNPALVLPSDSDINTFNNGLFITLPGAEAASHFKFLDDSFEFPAVADLDSITYRDNLFTPHATTPNLFLRLPMTDQNLPDYHHYVQFEPLVARPDNLVVKVRLRGNKNFNYSGSAHIGITLTDWFITGNITNTSTPNHIMELNNFIVTSMASIQQGVTGFEVSFNLTSLNNNQYNSFNLHPKVGVVVWHEAQAINPSNGLTETQFSLVDMELTVVEIEYIIAEDIETCTQFAYPRSDSPTLTNGIWEDNRGGGFTNRWNTVNQGVSTFNDNNHITYPTQIGQPTFPRIGFGVDQITLDPTSMKLNFRGGGIEPSGGVAHTMTFAALYDTNGVTVATNGSTPIASLSGDMRSYTVNMSLAIANREIWDLSRPQLEMKFFIDDTIAQDLRFSEVEIETCGTCPSSDTGNITLVLENLEDCEPENIMRPNTDVDILPSGEWTLCGEAVKAWPCVDEDVTNVTDINNIRLRELLQNRPTTMYWTEYGQGGSDIHDVPQASGMFVRQSNMTGGNLITILDSTQVESPDNLVVDWVHDYLYFTESGSVVMQRCELDGSNLTPICDLTDLTVEDTFIDFDENRLYFTTANSGTIEYLNLPSGGFPQNWATGFNHPTGLWKYQADMFVADAADGAVYTTQGGASKTQIVNGLGTASGLVGSACEGAVYVSDWETNGIIQRISIANPAPQIVASGIHIHGLDIDSRKGLLYYTTYGDPVPFEPGTGRLNRIQVDGDGPVVLLDDLDVPRKVNIDTAAEETHTSTLRFGLTDLSRCCLGPTSGYVSIKGAELSTPTSIESFAYIKAKIINPSGDVLWTARDNPGKLEDNNGTIQIETIGFNNQATNPDFANRTEWANAILQLDIEQFLRPIQPTGFGCPQLDAAFDLYAAQYHVTACSGVEANDNTTLFIDGSGDLAAVTTLYTRSGFIDSDSINPVPLVITNNALPADSNTKLFIEGFGDLVNDSTTLFLETLLSQSGNFDLSIFSSLEASGNMNLVMTGSIGPPINDTMNLFLSQKDITPSGQFSLFVTTEVMDSGNFTLFTNAAITHSGEMNLFTQAQDGFKTVDLFLNNQQINDNMNLVIIGPDGQFDNGNPTLIVHGATNGGQFAATTLFMPAVFNDNMNLVISGPGFTELTTNINLVLVGKETFGATSLFMSQNEEANNDNKTLFIDGPGSSPHSGNMNLFIARENDSIAGFGPTLFAATVTPESGEPTMFIDGGQDTVNNTTLFHKGAPIPSSDAQELYVHGF